MSAIGLTEAERRLWPAVRERLRRPGHLMAMMRGVLGDAEVAVIAAVTPAGLVTTLAVLAGAHEIAQEIDLLPPAPGTDPRAPWPAKIGDYDVRVLVDLGADGRPQPVAVLVTPWIEQHLLLYARQLWRRRRP